MGVVGDPITATLALGGMCGPEGTISHESFNRRRRVTLHVLIEEDGLPFYAESEEACAELGEMLGRMFRGAARRAIDD